MTTPVDDLSLTELMALLARSQAALDAATRIEDDRRQRAAPAEREPDEAVVNRLAENIERQLAEIVDVQPAATPALEPAEAEAPQRDETADRDLMLETALAECRAATESGYQMAKRHLDGNSKVIQQAKASLDRATTTAGSANRDSDLLNQLKNQIGNLETEHRRQLEDIDAKRKRLDTFNITLFGRTMAGKSTLMEILTKGDGKSIGNGAQRKTRDVRKYQWQGLTVTDVPGIAAFGGEADEEIAHHAAAEADLVLFLLTDDAPQDSEARQLARLRQQGRTMLGICNVKANVNGKNAIRRFIRGADKRFDDTKIRALSRQFDELADQYTPGRELPLVATHLLARYTADRMEPSDERHQLDEASRFQQVEDHILREVVTNGSFLRTRSFLDSAAVSDLETTEAMLAISNQFDVLRSRLNGRVQELLSWRESFSRRSNQQIDQLIQQSLGNLRNQMPRFVEQHYEDQQLGDKWNQRVKDANIERRMRETQERMAQDCRTYVRTLIEDIQEEIRLTESSFQRLSVETGPIRDTRGAWDTGVFIASSALSGITAGLLFGGATLAWNPLGWALLGAGAFLGILGLLRGRFKSKDTKRREAIAKITPELRKHLDRIENQIRTDMKQWRDSFTRQHLNQVNDQLNAMAQSCGQASTLLRETAWRQRDALMSLNQQTLELALRHKGLADVIPSITKVARIPGQAMVLATVSDSSLPDDATSALRDLFNESVEQTPDRLNARQTIGSLTEVYRLGGAIGINESARTARIQFDPADRQAQVQVRLASQLTGYYISNQTGAQ